MWIRDFFPDVPNSSFLSKDTNRFPDFSVERNVSIKRRLWSPEFPFVNALARTETKHSATCMNHDGQSETLPRTNVRRRSGADTIRQRYRRYPLGFGGRDKRRLLVSRVQTCQKEGHRRVCLPVKHGCDLLGALFLASAESICERWPNSANRRLKLSSS